MLIEFVGDGESKFVLFRGQDYRFVPNPTYEGARVLDVVDRDAQIHVLNITDLTGNVRRFRKYPMDALRDPDFLRAIDTNPAAAWHRLAQIDAGEVELDLEALKWQFAHSDLQALRLYAAQQGIAIDQNYPHHRVVEVLLDKFTKLSKVPVGPPDSPAESDEGLDLTTKTKAKRPRGRPKKKAKHAKTHATAGLAGLGTEKTEG